MHLTEVCFEPFPNVFEIIILTNDKITYVKSIVFLDYYVIIHFYYFRVFIHSFLLSYFLKASMKKHNNSYQGDEISVTTFLVPTLSKTP